MTRRLCISHSSALFSIRGHARDWPQWIFVESLRRTIFLVNIINVLAARVRKLHEDYYEPLNDEFVLDMRMPAPEPVWKACNAEQWVKAADEARQGLREDRDKDLTLRELLAAEETSGGVDEKFLAPLNRVILACARMQFRPNNVRE